MPHENGDESMLLAPLFPTPPVSWFCLKSSRLRFVSVLQLLGSVDVNWFTFMYSVCTAPRVGE